MKGCRQNRRGDVRVKTIQLGVDRLLYGDSLLGRIVRFGSFVGI